MYLLSFVYTIYCTLGIIHWCKIYTIFTITFQQWTFYNSKYLFYNESISNILNSDIIVTQIGTDTENSEHILNSK